MISELRAAINAAIEGAEPEGGYRITGSGFSTSWTVSPDPDSETAAKLAPRDLLAHVFIGGPTNDGADHVSYPVAVAAITANYAGTRQRSGSDVAVRATDRNIEAATHLAIILEQLGLFWEANEDPLLTADKMWIESTINLTYHAPKR